MAVSLRLLFLTFLCGYSALQAMPLSGRVINATTGEPISQVQVEFTCLSEPVDARMPMRSRCKNDSTTTQANGTFTFNLFSETRFKLVAVPPSGFAANRLAHTEGIFDYRHSVDGFVLKLCPESTISGKVLDETGQPKADVKVAALKVTPAGIVMTAKAKSNAEGNFVLRSLSTGDYYVATPIEHEDPNDPTNPYLFFAPSSLSLDQATLAHVENAQNFAGIEIHLRPTTFFHLQGRAQMESVYSVNGDPPQLELDTRDRSGIPLPMRRLKLTSDGHFETDVLPGSYTFRLIGAQLTPPVKGSTRPSAPVVHLLAKQEIEVSGKDLLGLMILMSTPINITGHTTLENNKEKTVGQGRIMLRPVDANALGGGTANANLQPDGTFALTNCDPARYSLRVVTPAGTYIKSVLFNEIDVTNQLIDLSRGVGGDLTLVLRQGAAALSGSITEPAAPDGMTDQRTIFDVVLIPDSWDPNGLIPLHHASSQQGRFHLSNLPPGHWTAVATTGVERSLWENVAFVRELQARGVGIDLAENEQKQITNVPLLWLPDIDQIEDHIGID